MDYDNLKSNSLKSRQAAEEQNKPAPIVKGDVHLRKQPLEKRLMEIIFPGSMEDIKEHMIFDVLIPGIRDNVWNMLTDGLSLLFSGSVKKKNAGKPSNGYVQYSNYSYGGTSTSSSSSGRTLDPPPLDDVVFNSKEDAYQVLDDLVDYISRFESVPVSYFYDRCGITVANWQGPNKWGWTNLGGARVMSLRGGGYVIDFPKPVYLH